MVHILFDTSNVQLSDFVQHGAGLTYFEGLPPYQRGRGYYVGIPRQRGAGLSSIFKGLWRLLLPMLKTTGKTLGQEGLATGSRILSGLAEGGNLKDTLSSEAKTGVENVVQRMQQGKGIKRNRRHNSGVIITPNSLTGRTVREKPTQPVSSIGSTPIAKRTRRQRADTFGLY